MAINVTNAATAYLNASKAQQTPGLDARDRAPGEGFGDLVKEAAKDALDTLGKGEEMSLKAVAKQADLADVVTAVTNAEMTLQMVIAVRDRVIQAYQDIIRMPI